MILVNLYRHAPVKMNQNADKPINGEPDEMGITDTRQVSSGHAGNFGGGPEGKPTPTEYLDDFRSKVGLKLLCAGASYRSQP